MLSDLKIDPQIMKYLSYTTSQVSMAQSFIEDLLDFR